MFLSALQGKGDMNTYWLVGRDGFDKPLPNFKKLFAADKQTAVELPMTTGLAVRKSSRVPRSSMQSDVSGGSVSRTDLKPIAGPGAPVTLLTVPTTDTAGPETGAPVTLLTEPRRDTAESATGAKPKTDTAEPETGTPVTLLTEPTTSSTELNKPVMSENGHAPTLFNNNAGENTLKAKQPVLPEVHVK